MNASNGSINTALVDSFKSFYFPFAIDCRHLAKDSEEFDCDVVVGKDVQGEHSRPFVGEYAVGIHAVETIRDDDIRGSSDLTKHQRDGKDLPVTLGEEGQACLEIKSTLLVDVHQLDQVSFCTRLSFDFWNYCFQLVLEVYSIPDSHELY